MEIAKHYLYKIQFNDILAFILLLLSCGVIVMFLLSEDPDYKIVVGTILLMNFIFVLPYFISRYLDLKKEKIKHKSTVRIEAKNLIRKIPLNERAFHKEHGVYVFGKLNFKGFTMELGKSYTLWIKGELIKLYLANYDAFAGKITGIVFNDDSTGGRRLITVSLQEIESQFISPTGAECMYEADIGTRGMTKVAQDHYFK